MIPTMPSGGGSNESFQVTPADLRGTAPTFNLASQDTTTLISNLTLITQQLIADMFLLSELTRLAGALENFYQRLSISLECLAQAQKDVGTSLDNTANAYEYGDLKVSNLMKQIESGLIIPGISTPFGPAIYKPGLFTSPLNLGTSGVPGGPSIQINPAGPNLFENNIGLNGVNGSILDGPGPGGPIPSDSNPGLSSGLIEPGIP